MSRYIVFLFLVAALRVGSTQAQNYDAVLLAGMSVGLMTLLRFPRRRTDNVAPTKLRRTMNKTQRLATVFVASMTFAGLSANAQNLLRNGSFESPNIAENKVVFTAPDAWTRSGASTGVAIINGDYSPGYPLPQQGQQYIALGHGASLTQSFKVSEAGNYLLTWFTSTEFNGPGNSSPYSFFLANSAGNTLADERLDANASGLRVWMPHSLNLSLPQDTYTLRMTGHVSFGGEMSLIDNVAIVGETASVPEPNSAALLVGMSVGGMALLCRRMRGRKA